MSTTLTFNGAPALIEARKNSADWQEAQSVCTALRLGQMGLNTKGIPARLAAMKPQHREALLDLMRRWVALDQDASALIDTITAELMQEVQA